jgi:phosphomannomutase/phosphoglucomutase
MSKRPRTDIVDNSYENETESLIKTTGFREYDARWIFGKEINLLGIQDLGRGLGTYIHERAVKPRIVVGHDYRSYSIMIKNALMLGLMQSGCEVLDIGLCLSPIAYFAQFDLDAPCVAMVTASHNENGWTGVKMGCQAPLTFGPDEIGRMKEIIMSGNSIDRKGGSLTKIDGVQERYMADISSKVSVKRKLKVIAACGNGTAGAFAPQVLRAMNVEVIEMDCTLDNTFPKYNPNPEDHHMLSEMAKAVKETGADLAFGFDGDGDRCGVVDDTGEEIFADKIGLMLARDLSQTYKDATFVVDVKSTGLYATDAVLKANGAKTVYWKTGHSYIKRKTSELNALAGFEKSGHFFFNTPLGRGYDDGIVAASWILAMLDRNPDKKLSDLKNELPVAFTSLTMSPHCADEIKYKVLEDIVAEYVDLAANGGTILGRKITEVITVNGARVHLDDGSWVLVRASSNKPELVVVVESLNSADDMRDLFHKEVKPRLAKRPEIGAYNQEI